MRVSAEKGLQERLSMGTLSLMSTLTRIRFLPTGIDRYASATPGHCTLQLSHLVLSSFLFRSLLPIQHDQSRVPYSGMHNMDNDSLGKNLVCTLFVCKGMPSDTVDDSSLLW